MDWNITHFLEGRSGSFLAFFGVALFAVVVFVDRTADWEITSSLIYVLPISFFAWYFSSRIGMLFALFSVFTWLYLNHLKSPTYSTPGVPYWNSVIHLGLYLILVYLVAEVKAIYLRERHLSRSDYLTGVINRRGFYEALGRERDRASRLKLPITLAYLDLDDFKLINDRFDHNVGDEVLASVGRTLHASIRNTDLAGRLGGDEFCILLPHADSEGARTVLDKVHKTLSELMLASGWPVTFSMGAVTFLGTEKSTEEMLRAADAAMYSAKEKGKNCIVYDVEPGIPRAAFLISRA
jgi:diguanylate cyclase (GGDEF)-like protein